MLAFAATTAADHRSPKSRATDDDLVRGAAAVVLVALDDLARIQDWPFT